MRMGWGKRIGIALTAMLVLAGGLTFIVRQVDALNVFYKRMKAPSPYLYEEINPNLAKTDPAGLITIHSAADVERARAALLGWIYGTSPGERRKSKLHDPRAGWSHAPELADWKGLGNVGQYYINVRPDVISYAYLLSPREPGKGPGAGKAVIYHNGMASNFQAAQDWLEPLLETGWTVLAFDQLGYGENTREIACDRRGDGAAVAPEQDCLANLQQALPMVENPVALHVEPILAGVDLLQQLGFREVDAFGFSAGAATVTFAAAVDPRIRHTSAAAGILPPYLREGQEELFGIAKELADNGPISFLDLFILAGSGEGRIYQQLFNRYDRCCFRNEKGRHYENTVNAAMNTIGVGGSFLVTIDESHARHAVSEVGIAAVMAIFSH